MTRLRFIPFQLKRFPQTNEALFAIALWPVLFAIGCWQTPQIAQFLNARGVEISMLQVFLAGFGAYLFLLGKHRVFNQRYLEHHAVDIAWYRRLREVDQEMVAAGLAGTDAHGAVMSEMAQLRKQLGFLVDADDFILQAESLEPSNELAAR
ncbi:MULTISPECIES: hypothetical protein [Pseudomonadaceae]|uniref:hypothetical protein n=1 Tax=Pseudomonadaceae TaxID=135621 RepID=UPI00103F2031|nr:MULTISPECIES: hypothetical protein [Pseudomonadaceae]MCQ4260980.1 hypothetical protein [Stutzerimonas stutzeri]TCD19182.1 hypothetical protein E0D86_19420 [Pseudomonas sp. IC_126]